MKKMQQNASQIMTLSGKGYQLLPLSNNNSPLRNNFKQIKILDQKGLSPWIGKQQKKQYQSLDKEKDVQHQFLSKIKFKNRKASFKEKQQQIINYTTKKGKTSVLDRATVRQWQYNKNFQEEIVIFPKSASSRDPNSTKKYYQTNNHASFSTTKSKWPNRIIKKSNIVSIDIDVAKSSSIQKLNPQKMLSSTIIKNMNPFQRSQKKKQLLKFKIKHHNRLKMYHEEERKQSLKNYLKYLTQSTAVNKASAYNRNPQIKQNLRNRLSLQINDTIQNRDSIQFNDIVCMGQTISSPKSGKKNKFKKVIESYNYKFQNLFMF